jgi:(S)-2-hydroxy-acid oxidase
MNHLPINIHDYQKSAQIILSKSIYDYYASGAHDEITLQENVQAYLNYLIRPRLLIDVSSIQLQCCILGQRIRSPIAIAPTAMQCMATSDGEKATARAAIRSYTIMILSSLSTTSLEDVAIASRDELKRLQQSPSTAILSSQSSKTALPTTLDLPQSSLTHVSSTPSTSKLHSSSSPKSTSPASSSSSSPSSSTSSSSSSASLFSKSFSLDYQDLRWFQLYVYRDREVTKSLVQRAEAAGYRALVLTIDTPQLGTREADLRNGFALPQHMTLANFASAEFSKNIIGTKQEAVSGLQAYIAALFDRTLSWKDIAWLRSITKLPIIVKGVLTKEDTLLALKVNVDAIIVSNHGARQLDGVPSTIDSLHEVVQTVRDNKSNVEVYLDGGIRRGTDVFKALALGARCVFVGRPVLWGLAHSGDKGVCHVLNILHNELELAMSLAGCPTINDVNRSFLTTKELLRAHL